MESMGLLVKKISESMVKHINARAKEYGLTLTQCQVLVFLFNNIDRKVTQRDIEEYLGSTHATVSGIIRRMKCKGLVAVTVDSRDRRAKNVSLVMSDKCLFHIFEKEKQNMDAFLLSGLTETEASVLRNLLQRIYDNIAALTPEATGKECAVSAPVQSH